jgi:hypothetical protein
MAHRIVRGRSRQHIDESEVNSKLKAWGGNSGCDSARHDAIGKLSLENSLNRLEPPPAFAARGAVSYLPTGEIVYCFRLIAVGVTWSNVVTVFALAS